MKENSIKDIIEEKYTRYLNCETDIIELTLEEAKFILETGERRNYVTSILQEAGKVLLSDYKRLESENKEFLYKYGNVLKENKELNEKWDKDTHKLQNDLDIANAKIIELLKENEELKDKIREHTLLISPYYVKENFIPVQIIEDFIKKYQKLGDEFYEKFLETNRTDKDLHDVGLACDAKVQVLQELLEGRKNE